MQDKPMLNNPTSVNESHHDKPARLRYDLYNGRTTIRSMDIEDRVLAEEHGVITGRDISFAFWDGSFPPPAEIRCHKRKHEQLGPSTDRVSGCMLLDGHAGECDFK